MNSIGICNAVHTALWDHASQDFSYVGMVMVWRTEQYWKAPFDMATREVGRTTLTRLEFPITTIKVR